LFYIPQLSLSQEGILRGVLKDKSTQEGLPFANIIIKEIGTGTTTDFEGNYSLKVKNGIYSVEFSYVGYESVLVTDVTITEGTVFPLSVSLEYESELLESVVVTAEVIANSESALLSVQRKSPNLLDGISAENFKKIGDSNVAAAIKRVPGVSIQGGKYVFVRGLGDRYTKTILNGLDIPGLDPDRNTLQMDIFPTNLIKNIVILKSSSADLPADFTGGIVNIEIKDFPEEKEFNISVSGTYNPSMHFKGNFPYYDGSQTDWLGFDNGMREIPIDRRIVIPQTVDQDPSLTSITDSFDPNLASKIGNSSMNFGLGITYGNQYNLKSGNTVGLIGSFNIKNDYTFYENFENHWMRKDVDPNVSELITDRYQIGSLGRREAFMSGLLGLAFKTDRSKFKVNLMHLQNGESRAGSFFQEYLWENSVELFKDNLEYTQRQISNVLLEGKHTNTPGNLMVEWKISPTLSKVTDPDLRLTPFRWDEQKYTIEPSESGDPTRIWRYLDEYNLNGKVDITKTYSLFSRESKFKIGSSYTFKERDFEILNYRVYIRKEYLYNWSGNPDEILYDDNLWTIDSGQGSYINGNYEISNTYNAIQSNLSLYLSNEFSFAEKIKSIIGLRAENYDLYYTGQTQLGDIIYDNENILSEIDFFPSINFIYSLKDMSNLRFSLSKTIARPSFKEKSIAQIFDPVTSTTFIGNIDILPTKILNYDLRWELFQENAQIYAFSLFYKNFTNPIELVVYNGASPNDYTPKNVDEAKVYGLELELRKNLEFISEYLSNLKLTFNTSIIRSEEVMDEKEYEGRIKSVRIGETVDRKRELQGQSPYLINLGLSYNSINNDLEASLNFNVQGKTLQIVGVNYVPDVYTEPFNSLNFNLNYRFGVTDNLKLGLGIRNLLDEKVESYYYTNDIRSIYSSLSPRREFKLSFGISF
tara:strand:- start:538 stop:3318 length:2781 start_codon:yes stop_codon:yes gene_type:complete